MREARATHGSAVPRLKICGVRTPEFAERAVSLGADYIGLIFAPESPRCVTVAAAKSVVEAVAGRAKCVGVFSRADVAKAAEIAREAGLDALQLHWKADADEVAAAKAAGFEVWTLAGGADADAMLFDSSHGDGERELRRGPWLSVLAGGIGEANLSSALAMRPDVIDVSGSLEEERGVKSVRLLESFAAEWRRETGKLIFQRKQQKEREECSCLS